MIHALILSKWLPKTFVTGDVPSFVLQGGGIAFAY